MKTKPFKIYRSIGADCNLPSVNEKLGNCYPVAVIPLYDKAALIERVAAALYDVGEDDGTPADPDDIFEHLPEISQDCLRIQAESVLRNLGLLPKKRKKQCCSVLS